MGSRGSPPEDCAQDHWLFETIEPLGEDSGSGVEFTEEEEKVLAGRPEANIPALLTMDVEGG